MKKATRKNTLKRASYLLTTGLVIMTVGCSQQSSDDQVSQENASQDIAAIDIPTKDSLADCDRSCINSAVESYVSSMLAQDASSLNLTDDIKISENGSMVNPGEGVWKTITDKGSYQQILIDSKNDQAVFFGAFSEGDDPLLLAIRFRFEGEKISELENLLSRPDDRNGLILRSKLTEPNTVYDEAVSDSDRLSRTELIGFADAYFDGIANSTDEGVPMHPACNRRENGVLLLQNKNPETEPCPIGFHRFNYITDIRDRRVPVVDEERGLVLMWAYFDIPGNIDVGDGPWGPSDTPSPDGKKRVDTRKIPRSLYIAELFKVVDGGIRDIEAIMFNQDLGSKSTWE